MTTKGTGITREEAEVIINLMDPKVAPTKGSMSVLKKVQKAYPDMIIGTPFDLYIRDYDRQDKLTKDEATKRISAILKDIHELFAKAEDIADKAGVAFYFEVRGADDMGGEYRDGGWNSSNC